LIQWLIDNQLRLFRSPSGGSSVGLIHRPICSIRLSNGYGNACSLPHRALNILEWSPTISVSGHFHNFVSCQGHSEIISHPASQMPQLSGGESLSVVYETIWKFL